LIIISFVLPAFTPAKAILIGVIALFIIGGFVSTRPGFYLPCAIALVGVTISAAFASALTNDGMVGLMPPLLMVTPIAAALYLSIRAAIICCILIVLLYCVLMVLDLLGYVSAANFDPNSLTLANLVMLTTATALATIAITLSVYNRYDLVQKILDAYRAVSQAESDAVQLRDIAELQSQKAVRASEVKSDFLANMSHELRTPLNGVIGMTQLLEATELDERQTRYLHAMRTSGDSLLHLINALLDISKIEAGRIEVNCVEISAQNVIENALESVRSLARQKDLNLNFSIEGHVPKTLIGDPRLLNSVLTSLLGNAVKFTESGSVSLEFCIDASNRLRFDVTDTGIGIPNDQITEIFERFYQAEDENGIKAMGSGLGLTISKDLIELMGGEYGVESEPGRGSTFWFAVPQFVNAHLEGSDESGS
jgi:signal transduction histidine kinase